MLPNGNIVSNLLIITIIITITMIMINSIQTDMILFIARHS